MFELQKERENDKREISNIKKEFEKNLKLKEIEIENATFKVSDFDKTLENKKNKINKLKMVSKLKFESPPPKKKWIRPGLQLLKAYFFVGRELPFFS